MPPRSCTKALSYQIRPWYWTIVQPPEEGEPNREFRWMPHLDGGLDSFGRLWTTSIWLRLAECSIRHHLDMRKMMAALAALYPERPKKVTPTEVVVQSVRAVKQPEVSQLACFLWISPPLAEK